jgi:hypothetical protein
MVKRTIAVWWIVGTIVMFAGGLAILFVAIETGTGGALHGHTGASAALLAASITVAAVGVILQLVAWTGAVFNTHLLADKKWFKVWGEMHLSQGMQQRAGATNPWRRGWRRVTRPR